MLNLNFLGKIRDKGTFSTFYNTYQGNYNVF
jgi:hypothetical protein